MSTTADFITGGAATVAALLSGVSLVFTRRWQQRDVEQTRVWQERDLEQERLAKTRTWVLDALKQALIDHINLSFTINRACNDGVEAKAAMDAVKAADAFSRAVDLHNQYMDLMVYLRLLGTPMIVTSAESLHESLDVLLDLSFTEEISAAARKPFLNQRIPRPSLTVAQAKAACMEHRVTLINDAREYLGLPRDAKIKRVA